MSRVIIAGTRTIRDRALVYAAIQAAVEAGWHITEVIHGGAIGVDRMGGDWAREHGQPVMVCQPDWTQHGLAAGPMRNRWMAEYAAADTYGQGGLILVWNGQSKGSKSMLAEARRVGLRVHELVVSSTE